MEKFVLPGQLKDRWCFDLSADNRYLLHAQCFNTEERARGAGTLHMQSHGHDNFNQTSHLPVNIHISVLYLR